MKLLLIACEACGAPNASPFGVCQDCESRRVEAAAASRRRVREQQLRGSKRAA